MKNEEIKTTEINDEALVHFNARVPKPMKETVKRTAKRAKINMEDLAQDAWRLYFGVTDKLLETRRMLALEAFKQETKGAKIPFDAPLIPINSNAALESRGEPVLVMGLHNGIVGVASSSLADSTILKMEGKPAHGSAVVGKHDSAVDCAEGNKAANGVPFSRAVGFKLETTRIPA